MESFFAELEGGKTYFKDYEFPSQGSAGDRNLSGLTFEYCFMFFDMTGLNLRNTKFINCNIKIVDFSGSDMRNVLIRGCSVEGMSMIGCQIEGLIFDGNWYMGNQMTQEDLEWFTKPIG